MADPPPFSSLIETLQQQIALLQQQISEKDEALFELSATMATIQAETTHEQQKWQSQLQQLQQSLRHAQQEANLAHATLQHQQQQAGTRGLAQQPPPPQNSATVTETANVATSLPSSNNVRKRTRSSMVVSTTAAAVAATTQQQDQRIAVTPPAITSAPEGITLTTGTSPTPRSDPKSNNKASNSLTNSNKNFLDRQYDTIHLAKHVLSMVKNSSIVTPTAMMEESQHNSLAEQLIRNITCGNDQVRPSTIPPVDLIECLVQLVVRENPKSDETTEPRTTSSSSLPWLVQCLTWHAKGRAHVRQRIIMAAYSQNDDTSNKDASKAPPSNSGIKSSKSRIRGLPNESEQMLHDIEERLKEPLIGTSWQQKAAQTTSMTETASTTATSTTAASTVYSRNDNIPLLPTSTTDWKGLVRVIAQLILTARLPTNANDSTHAMANIAMDLITVLMSDAPSDCPMFWIWFESLSSGNLDDTRQNHHNVLVSQWMALVQIWLPPSQRTLRRRIGLPRTDTWKETQEMAAAMEHDSRHDATTETKSPKSFPSRHAAASAYNDLQGIETLVRQWLLMRQLLSNSLQSRRAFLQPRDDSYAQQDLSSSWAGCTLALALDVLQKVVLPGIDQASNNDTEATIVTLATECMAWLQWLASTCCHAGDEKIWNLLQTPMLLTTTSNHEIGNDNHGQVDENDSRPRLGCSTVGVLVLLFEKIVLNATCGMTETTPSIPMMEFASPGSTTHLLLTSVVRALNSMYLCTTILASSTTATINTNRKSCASWKKVIWSEYPDRYKSACHSILAWAAVATQSQQQETDAAVITPKQPGALANVCHMIQYQLDELWQEE